MENPIDQAETKRIEDLGKEIMLNKLKRLEDNIVRMNELKERIEKERELFEPNFLDWALRYALLKTIQTVKVYMNH